MRAKRIRILGAVSVALVLVAVGYWHFSYTRIRVARPGQPVVFYDEDGTPSEDTPALSKTEIKRIIRQVATQTHDPVWLIWVRPSHIYDAYVVPDEVTPRTRLGRVYSIRQSEPPTAIGSGGEYVQICPPGCTFTPKLTKPSAADMPFDYPTIVDPNSGSRTPMPMADIVGLVDFVRQQAGSSRTLSPLWHAQKLPVLDMKHEGNTIRVDFGFMHDLLWGHGVEVEIECTPTGYKMIDCSPWIS